MGSLSDQIGHAERGAAFPEDVTYAAVTIDINSPRTDAHTTIGSSGSCNEYQCM